MWEIGEMIKTLYRHTTSSSFSYLTDPNSTLPPSAPLILCLISRNEWIFQLGTVISLCQRHPHMLSAGNIWQNMGMVAVIKQRPIIKLEPLQLLERGKSFRAGPITFTIQSRTCDFFCIGRWNVNSVNYAVALWLIYITLVLCALVLVLHFFRSFASVCGHFVPFSGHFAFLLLQSCMCWQKLSICI